METVWIQMNKAQLQCQDSQKYLRIGKQWKRSHDMVYLQGTLAIFPVGVENGELLIKMCPSTSKKGQESQLKLKLAMNSIFGWIYEVLE